jgi:DMSO/TMAO reductase YedYZ molybdopterin-dependent catalytic subunit
MTWAVAGLALLALAAPVAPAPAQAQAQAQAQAPAHMITISGMVAHAGPMDDAALAALKQVHYKGRFNSMSGEQTHDWTGPLLLDVLDRAGLTDEPGKRTHIRHVILARGSDGYAAALAIGEIDPKAEGKQVIVALTQDGRTLDAPRLVVPGDASLTRCVHDLTVIEVR